MDDGETTSNTEPRISNADTSPKCQQGARRILIRCVPSLALRASERNRCSVASLAGRFGLVKGLDIEVWRQDSSALSRPAPG